MLITEYDYEEEKSVIREEALEEAMEKAMEKAREVVWEEAWKDGMEKGSTEIARNFKKLGIPIEQIAEGTGLTKDEIEKL